MHIKKILLTGDDGYNSLGTRLLIHFLKDQYELTVIGTKDQQSGVGGRISMVKGCVFGETTIDGVRAIWVDGSPADCMEFAEVKFKDRFDLVISGVNLGENISSAIISSGTVSAASRGLGVGIAPRAIAISWCTPADFYFKKHDQNESLEQYLKNPGEMTNYIIHYALKEKLWDSKFLNINLPRNVTKEIAFTRLHPEVRKCYPSLTIQEDTSSFAYPLISMKRQIVEEDTDVAAVEAGKISITPINPDWTDQQLLRKLSH